MVESLVQAVVLEAGAEAVGGRPHFGDGQHGAEVEALRLVVVDGGHGVEQVDAAHGLLDGAKTKRSQVLAHLFGDELEEVLHEFGCPGEAFAQLGVLGGDPHRTGIRDGRPAS